MATNDSPLSVAPTRSLSLALGQVGGSFTPMVAEDFSSGSLGSQSADWTRSEFQNSVVKSGSQALQLKTDPAQPGGACGGSVWYGGRQNLPVDIPVGKTVWQRIWAYFPSEFSFGYSYNKWNMLAAAQFYSGGETSIAFTESNTTRPEEEGAAVSIQLDSGTWHHTTTAAGTDNAANILAIADPLPSAVSPGNKIKTGSLAEAQQCGTDIIDGSAIGGLKFLVFSPNSGNPRIYLQPMTPHKEVTGGTLGRILDEYGPQSVGLINGQITIPRDQWISFQLAVKVANTQGDGWLRAWMDDELVAERLNINTISTSATGISQWGIGDYWNGMPFTDGLAGRDTFYIDDIIVASDVDGYGAPTDTDANGNAYIATTTLVGDL